MKPGLRPMSSLASCACCHPFPSAFIRMPPTSKQPTIQHRQQMLSSSTTARSSPDEMETLTPMSVELPTYLSDWLEQKAKQTGRSASQLMAEAVENFKNRGTGASESMTTLYVMEPIVSLVDGLLHGEHTVSQGLSKGNFGIGTLDMLDGEVVVYQGVAYHQASDGVTRQLTGNEMSPFMTMTWHTPEMARLSVLTKQMTMEELHTFIKKDCMRSENVFYSITVEGSFPRMKTRAVRRQEGNTRLVDVAKTQVVFDNVDEKGILVGFWTPPYMGSSISVPGFHLHYLSDDRTRGGHLLNCVIEPNALVTVQEIHRTKIDLPYRADYMGQAFTDATKDIEAAEKER